MEGHVPFDGEARDTRLLSQDLPLHLLDDRLRRRLKCERLVNVLVVDVVSNTHKLSVFVAAAEQDDCDTNDLAVRDARKVWGVGAEEELVDAYRQWANENGIEFLVILVAGDVSTCVYSMQQIKDLRGSRADIGQLPFKICLFVSLIQATGVFLLTLLQLLKALEGDLELVGRVELRGVVLHLNAEKRDDRHFVVSISRSV